MEDDALDEFYFQWHLTERCNSACRHCYQVDSPISELPLSELMCVVDLMEQALDKWGKRGTLSLTGGEPFLRREDLYALMTRLDHSQSFDYYDILTNGSLVQKEEAADLSTHDKLRRVQVSLEGAQATSNDAIRGKGSFAATLEAISHLRKMDIKVAVMITLTRANKGEIPALVDLLNQHDVQYLAVERLIPEGHGADLAEQVLDCDELRKVFEKVHDLSLNQTKVRILMHRPLFASISPDDPEVGAMCSAGNNALTIMPDATVYPCRRIPIPIGNALRDGFFRIWYTSEVLWQIRNPGNLKGKCNKCELLSQCRGCRAAAYFAGGDFMAEDPQCWK